MTIDLPEIALRVISLLPAGTQIVTALGGLECLVGISHECDYPPAVMDLPRVTASAVNPEGASAEIDAGVVALVRTGAPLFALRTEDLRRLAPTLIITQTLCDVCAVSEGEIRNLASVLDPAPRIIPLGGSTVSGVLADVRMVGDAIGRSPEADLLLVSLNNRMQEVHRVLKAARARRPRVAVIEWLDPVFVAGHWTPELVKRGGGIDVLAQPGAHSLQASVEQVREAKPELLLFVPCGFSLQRSAREARALLATEAWSWAGGVESWALDGNALTSRPGPRLADAVDVIAAIVAPTLFAAPAPEYALRL